MFQIIFFVESFMLLNIWEKIFYLKYVLWYFYLILLFEVNGVIDKGVTVATWEVNNMAPHKQKF